MTNSKRSYNMQALRGMDVDDSEIATDFREMGFQVPDEVLYTPKFPEYLIDQMYEHNLTDLQTADNPITGLPYTEDEAKGRATELRAAARMTLKDLMK